MKKRGAALLLAAAMAFSTIAPGAHALATGEGFVADQDLTAATVAAPAKDAVIPNANQYEYQKQELAAFCHFGPNTFNEIEWGEHYGTQTPDQIFKLEANFDADKLVSSLKAAGFQKLIVTAKHHDGFCIWNSQWTEYDVESTSYAGYNYDGLGGDILAEISKACTDHDMDMGLYLSPWDIHDESYGYYDQNHNPTTPEQDAKDYNDYYNNQLEEILSSPLYGNNGHFKEVWMDGAKGSGANAQDYDFQRWFTTIQKYEGTEAGYPAPCMLFGAEAYSTVRWIGNENGYANEETWSKSKVNYENNTIDSNRTGAQNTFVGYEDGNQWTVPEVDARITSGWFWGNGKKTPKSLADLGNMYFHSVGHNAPLLLNIPPNDQGSVDQAILDRVAEFGNNIAETFQLNLAKDAAASASEVRGTALDYKPGNVLDGNEDTYWTVNDGTATGTLQLDLGGEKTFDVVSIEEAIAFGQRIKEFRVEYSVNGSDWKVFDQGTTIGAKRLCRKAPVTADKLRITVTTSGAVPMLSEVGVYKASESFAKAQAAPRGMDVIDTSDTAPNARFVFGNNWHPETGDQYLNGTNSWANAGTHLEVKFTGSKIYLIGTRDPNHGTARVTIDGKDAVTIDTAASARAVGQMIYASEDLPDGEHTLRLETTNKAIGVEGAYVINNGSKGMVGIEQNAYTMNEDETLSVKLVRVGGSTGAVTVNFAPNPGSAIQDDYNTELNQDIIFAEGETVKQATVQTKRNKNATGDQYFTVALSSTDKMLILGFNDVARINIVDAESLTLDQLSGLVDACKALNEVNYTADSWQQLTTALQAAEDLMAAGNASAEQLLPVYEALETAKAGLVVREHYAADDRFAFPAAVNGTVKLEAELLEAINNPEGDNNWPLQVNEADWASNGKFLNSLNANDAANLYYTAAKAGTYKAVVTFRSGDANNGFTWTEADGKIPAGSVVAGAADAAGATHTKEFEFVVETAGEGVLCLKGAEGHNAPQLDCFAITLVEEAPESLDQIAANAVMEQINAIGTVTLDSEADITAARTAYNALTETQKALVTNLNVLTEAEKTLQTLQEQAAQDAANKAAAAAVMKKINAIGMVTLDSEADITAARTAYDALTETQKVLVTNLNVLTEAEKTLQTLQEQAAQDAANKAAAAAVEAKINAIGTVTLDSEADITAARKAYDALTETQKVLVTNLNVLTEAEKTLQTLQEQAAQDAADKAAAAAVEAKINAIGMVTLESEADITAARTAYNALTETQKALVTNLNVLTEAEAKLAELKKPTPAPTEKPIVPEPTVKPVVPEPTQKPVVPEPTEKPIVPEPTQKPVAPTPTAKPVVPTPTAKPVIPAPTEKPAVPQQDAAETMWLEAITQISAVPEGGKITIDAGDEIAVPHYVWQSFYGKNVTVIIQHGAERFVFHGRELQNRGFDPDTGHNLTDLTAYSSGRPAGAHGPSTGDSTHMLLWTAAAMLSAAGTVVLKKKKKQ